MALQMAAATLLRLAAAGHDVRHASLQDQLLCLHHIDKADRHTDDQLRLELSFLNQLIELDQGGGGVAMAK